ncbi:hypothetical protein PQX77_019700 [Marasmius sp. AFHP31]|nr:hypothetical protein PQX77_019700 [Marasmius sp. AFHP31]
MTTPSPSPPQSDPETTQQPRPPGYPIEIDQPLAIVTQCYREAINIPADNHPIAPQLLHSNYIPTDNEIYQTRMFMLEEERALATCETGIANLYRVLDELKRRKRALKKRINHRRAAVSVKRRIPVELWEQIFTLVSTTDGHSLQLEVARRASTAPGIFLSHVCSHWRNIMLSTPAIWASIEIHFASDQVFPSLLPHPSLQHLLELYLCNSRQHPLRIELSCDYFQFSIPESAQELYGTLIPHMQRCESLYCSRLGGEFAIPNDSLPNLITLIDNWMQPIAERQVAYKNASRLTSITTSFLYPLHDLPYHQLTSFECHGLKHRGTVERLVRQVLPACKNLESLTLVNIADDDPGPLVLS